MLCFSPSHALTQCLEIMCTPEKNFQGVTVTFAEMTESSKGQEEHLKHRPMTFASYSLSHPVRLLQLPSMGVLLITWDRKKVIHRGDVIHGLCQHSDLLLPLVFEDVHVVLSDFALWPGGQCESGVDDLFVRSSPATVKTRFRRGRGSSKIMLKPWTL